MFLPNRNIIILTASFLCFFIAASCQPVTGIFLTEKDFLEGKLAFVAPCKIQVRSSSPNKLIRIKCADTTRFLHKDSVYGYQDRSHVTFRLFQKIAYALINPREEIRLYKIQTVNSTKYEPAFTSYFFSRSAGSAIYPLTIDNILKAFPDNKRFSELVELKYRNDSELMEFDTYHNKYKLNHLLEISKN